MRPPNPRTARLAAVWMAGVAASSLAGAGAARAATPAASPAEVQAQLDALQAQVQALQAELASLRTQVAAPIQTSPPGAGAAQPPIVVAAAQPVEARLPSSPAAAPTKSSKAWYDRLQLRGYTQMRYNALLSGGEAAPDGMSRLRSVHDASINEDGGFSLRRVRLILQGDITDRISLYLQPDFGTAVSNQSGTERREHFGQLRDAYVDLFDRSHQFRLRFGQSKVPFGWENLQSSSNRIPLDRSDAINSAVPGERDLGVVAYYTPPQVQAIWDRLAKDGHKLFGNYGAFGLAAYNGQGTNRTERNGSLMKVAMATWPIALDGLGGVFEGQVLEVGGSAMLNKVRPETRAGGVSAVDYDDKRVVLHTILYPQPFGIQAEWTWGRGPQYDTAVRAIREARLGGGYVQLTYNGGETALGRFTPYGRWQRYRGGWKAGLNAPRLETDELELGVEWQFMKAAELTFAYAHMKRREADERRMGRADGQLFRTQLQWNY